MRAYSAGSAFAIDSPLVRGGLTAIAWLQSLPSPFIVVATLAEAEGWARNQLQLPAKGAAQRRRCACRAGQNVRSAVSDRWVNDDALTIRPAILADVPFIADSNAALAWETEHKALDRHVLEKGVQAVFADARRGFYLVAERGARAVGCLLVTFEWSDWRNGDWWWIQSVYVIATARRRGVFRALYADVERRARAAVGVVGLRLYVEHENAPALATYASLGMEDAGYRLMQSGFLDFGAEPKPAQS